MVAKFKKGDYVVVSNIKDASSVGYRGSLRRVLLTRWSQKAKEHYYYTESVSGYGGAWFYESELEGARQESTPKFPKTVTEHCFKLFDLTAREMRRVRTVIEPFVRRYGVRATFMRNVAYVHLTDNQAYTVILNFFGGLLYKGKLTATKRNMDWLRGFTI